MIFVTVGMHTQGFERLIKKMDEISGKTEEEVIMQIGWTNYKPKNAKFFRFKEDFQEIQELNMNARVVVCHGGAGTIITALEQGTPVIAIPRLKIHNEHLNDHQLELVDALAQEGKIVAVYDIENLENKLKVLSLVSLPKIEENKSLVLAIKMYINDLSREFVV